MDISKRPSSKNVSNLLYEYDAEGKRVAQIDQITDARTEYAIDESSNVLTATEIDNGNRFVTTYLYNGEYVVATDANGLYYYARKIL